MIHLHPHQSEMRNSIISEIRKKGRRILLQSATGSGKTVIASSLALGAQAKKTSLYFIVHRKELITQSMTAFSSMCVDYGVIAPGFSPRKSLIQIAMVGTLVRRTHLYPAPDTIVIDEAHHAVAGTWHKLLSAYPTAIVIGLTATPQRLDGKGLASQFDSLICGPSVEWLIKNKFLAKFRAFSPPTAADLSDLNVRAGDYKKEEIQSAMDRPTITGDAIGHYRRLASGKRMIVFCAGITHSENVAAAYRDAGITAEHCDGKTPSAERNEIMGRFRSGETTVICNVGLISEGFDVPAAGAVQILRPTASLGLHLQMLGRVLRYESGKIAIILDHVGNLFRHGLPDEEHKWSLEGRVKKKRGAVDSDIDARQCPGCDGWCKSTEKICPGCGFEFPVKPREEIKHIAGELVEHVKRPKIDFESMPKWQRARAAETLADLRIVANLNGYRRGWAAHKFREMQAAKTGGYSGAQH